MSGKVKVYGLMVQFLTPEAVLQATRQARQAGYRAMDAYTPYTVEGLAIELGMRPSRIPSVVLIGGLIGAGSGYFMQYYTMVHDYPFNAGGRPYHSWPAFFPVTFELMILVASLVAFLSFILLNGLPHPNHPVFNVPEFIRSSQDRFFFCIEATDKHFDLQATTDFLSTLDPHGDIIIVPVAPEAVEEPDPKVGGKAETQPTVSSSNREQEH